MPSARLGIEWEPRELSEPLRQGDVFRWTLRGEPDRWRAYGIVVTADCDFANAKHRGVLSYCPILPLADFLAIHWLPEDLLAQKKRYLEATIGQLRVALKEAGSDY